MKRTCSTIVLGVALVGIGFQPGSPRGSAASAAQTVFISPEEVTLQVGQFSPLIVIASDGTPVHDAILTITEPSVAEIDSDAVQHRGGRHGVRGRTPGFTTVTAKTANGVARAAVRVVGRAW